MSKLTTYPKPSIAERIATAPNVQALAFMRGLIAMGLQSRVITAEDKTVERWGEALWSRVIQLMGAAQAPGDLCFIRNVTLTWDRSPRVEALLEAAFQLRARQLPSDAELLLRRGITIEGVTKFGDFRNEELKRNSIS
jgi:hypothetical protein